LLLASARAAAEEPLPAPRADEQTPKPYFAPATRERRLELLDVGPDLGMALRPAEGDTITYSVGLTYGAHARVEILRWLGFRAIVHRSSHAVSADDGALLSGTRVDHPKLDVLHLGARVEPTWVLYRGVRLWAGLGVGWDRIWADRPTLTGRQVQAADRTGVAVEYSATAGATLDIVPKWFAVSLSLGAALVASQSGGMFEPLQAVDEDISRPNDPLVYIAGLPEFEGAYSAVLGLGLLL
jgi:hypothetical protein